MTQGDCIFCKIVTGDIPSFKIYEDDKFLAFLDAFPLVPGHTQIVPKKHYRWVWDVEPAGEYFEFINKVANHYRKVLGEDKLIVSLTIGEDVPHAHYHLIPDHENVIKWFEKYSELRSKEMISGEGAKEMVEKLKL